MLIHDKKCPGLSILNPDSTNTVLENRIRLVIVTYMFDQNWKTEYSP